jgi:hypothetical protein
MMLDFNALLRELNVTFVLTYFYILLYIFIF